MCRCIALSNDIKNDIYHPKYINIWATTEDDWYIKEIRNYHQYCSETFGISPGTQRPVNPNCLQSSFTLIFIAFTGSLLANMSQYLSQVPAFTAIKSMAFISRRHTAKKIPIVSRRVVDRRSTQLIHIYSRCFDFSS